MLLSISNVEPNNKDSLHPPTEQNKSLSLEGAEKSAITSNDTDFGEWIPPSTTLKENEAVNPACIKNADMKKYIDRIFELVGTRTNGVWSTQIDVEYSRMYKEKLPEKWPDQVENNAYGEKQLLLLPHKLLCHIIELYPSNFSFMKIRAKNFAKENVNM